MKKPAGEESKRFTIGEMEARDRRGYEEHPEDALEIAVWEGVAAWPDR